jgi:hypothetical protein
MRIELDDGRILTADDFEASWKVEFEAGEAAEIQAFNDLGVDGALCESVTVAKTADNKFFAWWKEEHPERGFLNEYCGGSRFSRPHDPTREQLNEWEELEQRMPSHWYVEEITRRQAFEIISWFFLPGEFHADAGL